MKNLKNLLLGTLAVSALLTSCRREDSENVNQDRIFTEYRIVYEESSDKSYARTTFRFKDAVGTKLELTNPASVSFAGDQLTFQKALAYYEKDYAGKKTSGTFSYIDLDGKTFTNSVTLDHEVSFPSSLDTIKKGAAFTLNFEGGAIKAGETITVTINGENEADAKIFTTTSVGATSIILAKDKLAGIGTGPGKIYMNRVHVQTLAEGTSAGGLVWSKHVTTPKDVYIAD